MIRMLVLTVAVFIVLGTVISACGAKEPPQNAPTITEAKMSEPGRFLPKTEPNASRWPPEHVKIKRERAVEIARTVCTKAFPGVPAAFENPRNPVARLMRFREFEDRIQSQLPLHDSNPYVWVVQFEGDSFGASPGQERWAMYRYAACAVDARDGVVRGEFRRQGEPLILPTEMLNGVPSEIPDVHLGSAVEAEGTVQFEREAAIALAQKRYGGSVSGRSGGYFLAERAEAELVRYTGTCHRRLEKVPTATPTPGGLPGTPRPQRVQCGAEWGSEDSRDRLTWLVIIPAELRMTGCGPERTPLASTCWSQPVFALIDAETGEQYGDGGSGGVGGPRVTNEEFLALTRFAGAQGWWELWHRVRAFADQPLPEGYAASLDHPDAPAPTATPVPAVPLDASPPPTPTPRPRMLGLLVGVLVDRDGCLSVAREQGTVFALVWKRGEHLVNRDGSTVVVTDTYDGKTVTVTWQLGQEVRLGGGTSGPPFGKEHGTFTVGDCAGPYFLVGDVK